MVTFFNMNSQGTDMGELVGLLYTILEEAKGPLSLGDLCASTKGLRRKANSVAEALTTMCDNGIVTVSENKYSLTDKVSEFVSDKGDAASRRESYQNIVESSGRSPMRPVASGEARSQGCALSNNAGTPASSNGTGRDTARLQSFSVGNQDSAIAVRTNRPVVTSRNESSTSMTVLGSEKDQYKDIMTKIVAYMKKQSKPVKAHLVAKAIDIGSSKSDVNRYLYCLQKNGVLEKIGTTEWKITKSDVSEQDLDKYASVMAGTLSSTSKAHKSNSTTEMDGGCVCPKRGPSCNHYHITNNIQNNVIIGDRIA